MPRSRVGLAIFLLAWSTGFQCLCFHFKIDLRVAVGRLQRDMAEPSPDGINVDPSAEQMHGSGVPNGMGTDLFVPQRGGRPSRFCDRTLDERVNAKTRDALTPDVEEHRSLLGAFKS